MEWILFAILMAVIGNNYMRNSPSDDLLKIHKLLLEEKAERIKKELGLNVSGYNDYVSKLEQISEPKKWFGFKVPTESSIALNHYAEYLDNLIESSK